MNIKQIKETAKKQGFTVEIDKTGPKYIFILTDIKNTINPQIKTDRRGAELFLADIDHYLNYCAEAGIDPF